MKKKLNPAVATLKSIAFFVFIAIIYSACGRKIDFGTSQIDPGADGYVKLGSDKNNNTTVRVKIDHLAPPGRLNPPGNVYVVWMTTEHDGIRNIGQLRNTHPLFSNARKAELKTVTAFKPRSFFITAEESGHATDPRHEVVLKTE